MDQCFHILVSGRVQGGGYRNFVLRQAREIPLRGQVRNLRDGRVEILIMTSEQKLAGFLVQLKKGPSFSSVENLVFQAVRSPDSATKDLSDFKIAQDGEAPWSFAD